MWANIVLYRVNMDTISALLQRARLEASLDRRCLLSRSTDMPVTAHGPRQAPFHVLMAGRCRFHTAEQAFDMAPGDVVLLPSGRMHRITVDGPGRMAGVTEKVGSAFFTTRSENPGEPVVDLFCGHFTVGAGAGALLFDSMPDPIHVSFGRSDDADRVLRQLSDLMRGEAEREGQGTAAILSALCTALLAMVLRTCAGTATSARLWTAASDPNITAVIDAVREDPAYEWSIDVLARAARMSRSTFVRRFSRDTGMSVATFVTRSRLMSATELLQTGGPSVAQVASSVGYSSESAFSRAFRSALGLTPAEFRRQNVDR